MSSILYSELRVGSDTLRFKGTGGKASTDGLVVTDEGVEGWYSTPDVKTSVSERGQGDGAHDVSETDITYSARTVTAHCAAVGSGRQSVVETVRRILRAAHRLVTFRLVDSSSDTYVTGYASVAASADWHERWIGFDLTIVCPRPERLSWRPWSGQMRAAHVARGGLYYGDKAKGLAYPLSYGVNGQPQRNTVTMANHGSSRAYPVFTVNGSFEEPVRLECSGDGRSYSLEVQSMSGGSAPIVLDSRSRTATRGGADASRLLLSRGFPVIEPGGSVTVRLLSAGSGWVDAEWRDTWM